MKRALSYPLKLIAKNAGVNGSVVSEKVFTYSSFFWYYGLFLKHAMLAVLSWIFSSGAL